MHINGYEIKRRKGLNHWEPLFEEWCLLMERYARTMDGNEAPYMFNERANIGVIAGAAWRSGSIALEEYQSEKGLKYRPKWQGRVDLWITKDGIQEDVVEAKFKWVSMDAKKEIVDIVKPVMDVANDDAKKSARGIEDFNAIGLGFFPLSIPVLKVDENIDEYILETLKNFKKLPYDGIAWSFPTETRYCTNSKENRYLPGIVLLIQNNKF